MDDEIKKLLTKADSLSELLDMDGYHGGSNTVIRLIELIRASVSASATVPAPVLSDNRWDQKATKLITDASEFASELADSEGGPPEQFDAAEFIQKLVTLAESERDRADKAEAENESHLTESEMEQERDRLAIELYQCETIIAEALAAMKPDWEGYLEGRMEAIRAILSSAPVPALAAHDATVQAKALRDAEEAMAEQFGRQVSWPGDFLRARADGLEQK